MILQFPFYAGIFGIIQYSGLQDVIGGWFVAIANDKTYPAIIYWYSGILNYFVPSGGSKWAIEAPYVVQAAATLKVPQSLNVLTYAWGDMMTDIIQPFWAIPLLAIARLTVIESGFDWVGAAYRRHKLEGMLNTAIVHPLLRALFGKRLRQPCSGEVALISK